MTLNIRGLCDVGKNMWLGFEIRRKGFNLVGLSETKISNEKQTKSDKINSNSIYEQFQYNTYWNYPKNSKDKKQTPSRGSGTTFIYCKSLDQFFQSIESDNDGRAIMIRFKINDIYLRIIQLYCETNQRNIRSRK